MNWYYVDAGQQAGPVDEGQLQELYRSGKVQPDTLVWHEGMANWQPYREAMPQPATAAAPGMPAAGANEAVCSQCGRIFNTQEMISYGGTMVCAGCKPMFVQKLAEGVQVTAAGLRYAGFWIRFLAKMIDGFVILAILSVPLIFLIIRLVRLRGAAPTADVTLMQLGIQLGFYVVNGAYTIFFLGKYGATPGKMACKLHVVTAQGEKITYGRATGRFFAEILSGIICDIGYIIAAFDQQKRSLHDHICNTRVVYKQQ